MIREVCACIGIDLAVIDVIIPTYKPDETYLELIEKLNKQTIPPDHIIVMNTEEKYYDNMMLGKAYNSNTKNVEVHHISKREFDHGKTRNKGVKKSDADIFIMMTQDAMPANERMIEELIEPLKEDDVVVSYARQLAAEDANYVEQLTRRFNYPPKGRIKSKADIEKLQIKTYFASNVCCAYKREVFDELGGFVNKTIFNEDMIYASKVINRGMKVAYAAQAQVVHSHNYNSRQQFMRNFDNGVSHRDHPEAFEGVRAEGEGMKMVTSVIRKMGKNGHTLEIPGYIWMTGCKYLGYKLGENYDKLPMWLVNRCTTNKEYFHK